MKLFFLRRTTFAESRSKTKIYIDVAGERRNVSKFSTRGKFPKKNLLFFQKGAERIASIFSCEKKREKLNVAQLWEDALANSVNHHNGGVVFNARLGPKLCC